MHLALLPGLMLALAGGVFNGPVAVAPDRPVDLLVVRNLYSVAAQVTETTTTQITATSQITATGAITGTGTLTTPLSQNTPPPLPTGADGGVSVSLRLNPFDWNFLSRAPDPRQPLGPFGWLFVALMLGLFGVSAYFYFFKRVEWKRTNSVLRRAAERWAPIGLWVAGLALLFAVFRVISLDFFNARIWLYLWFLAAIALGAWFFRWYKVQLPLQLARHAKTQRARQYMPSASKKGSIARSPALTPRAGSAPQASTTSTKVVPSSGATPAVGEAKKRRNKK